MYDNRYLKNKKSISNNPQIESYKHYISGKTIFEATTPRKADGTDKYHNSTK